MANPGEQIDVRHRNGESEGKTFYEIIQDGEALGMQTFDTRILRLFQEGLTTEETAVILREGFGSATGDGNPVLEHLAEMGMATRRLMHVVLVSPGVRSHDASAAFARSVDQVLHINDLPHLAEALKRSRAEAEQAYRVLLDSLRAAEKG